MKKIILLVSALIVSGSLDALPIRFINNRPWSIYLEIPGVMNPNLTPFSRSTAGLEPGQVVYFVYKKQRQVLFTMDFSYANRNVKIGSLVKKRKKEIKKSNNQKM